MSNNQYNTINFYLNFKKQIKKLKIYFSLTTLQPHILTPSYQLNDKYIAVVTLLKNKGYNPLTTAYNRCNKLYPCFDLKCFDSG
jgi:hypothetical protein